MERYFYNKDLGFYIGRRIGNDLEVSQAIFDTFNGKKVLFENGNFSEAPKTIDDINEDYEKQVQSLTSGVPQSEIATWTKQESEARAWLIDNATQTPLIDQIVANRPLYTKEELVNKIIAKADLYAQSIGQLTGLRQSQEDNLNIKE